jgi:hypothetical protein
MLDLSFRIIFGHISWFFGEPRVRCWYLILLLLKPFSRRLYYIHWTRVIFTASRAGAMNFDKLAFFRIYMRLIRQLNHFTPIFVIIILVGRSPWRLILDVNIEIRFIVILLLLILLAISDILCLCLLDFWYPSESLIWEHVELLRFLKWHHPLT